MKTFSKRTLSILLSATILLTTFAGITGIGQVMAEGSANSLYGQSVLVSGDSIAAGWRDTYKEKVQLDIWDGSTRTAPKDSNSDGVYEITNGAELAYIVYNSGTIGDDTACNFILTKDIYLNDIDKIDWTTGQAADGYTIRSWYRCWLSAENYVNFAGTIDGDGHTVYGLYFNLSDKYTGTYDGAALIPRVAANGTVNIKDLAIDNAYVNYTSVAAAFVGYAQSGSTVNISGCYAGSKVTLNAKYTGVFRGSAKSSNGGVLENSYSLATANGSDCYGLFAFLYDSASSILFKNCYNAGGPLSYGEGVSFHCVAENCFETAASMKADGSYPLTTGVKILSADYMQGTDALTNESKMLGLDTSVYTATTGYPVLSIFEGADDGAFVGKDKANGKGWGIRLEKEYGMKVTNAALGGNSLTEINNRKRIIAQLNKYKNNKYDYVLLEGGFNDAMGQNTVPAPEDNSEIAPYGEISDSFNVADFDTTTFAGALEEYFYYAKLYFPTAKVGYIVTYQTPQSQYGGRTADVAAMRIQWDLAKEI